MLDCYCLYLYSRIAAKTDAATSGACMADSVDQSEFADIMEVYASGQASSTVGKLKLEWLYSWQHINESKVLHTYVTNEFLTASYSRQTNNFWKISYQDL